MTLSGGFGGVAAWVALPMPGRAPFWLRQLRELPAAAWIGIAAAALLVLAARTAVSWMLQAATMRGAAMAAERGSFSVVEALKLGRQRLISLLTLSVIFGAIIGALGLLPLLIIILLGSRFEFAITLMNGAQTLLVPGLMLLAVSTPLGAIALVIGGLLLTPLAGFLFTFIAVFTLVLYTLAYREAARLTTATT